MYDENIFVNLTYRDKDLPENSSLDIVDFQLFMKRLRKEFSDRKIRVFYCGEYGGKSMRPHFHAILFNLDFKDKTFYRLTDAGNKLYMSSILDRLWKKGGCTIGAVTFESAAYVARYCMKKVVGRDSDRHYEVYCPETGEFLYKLTPEFAHMSRAVGVGRAWFERFASDCYPKDFINVRGVKMRPPKAYDKWLRDEPLPSKVSVCNIPNIYEKVMAAREEHSFNRPPEEETEERLRVKEAVKLSRIELLKRGLDT